MKKLLLFIAIITLQSCIVPPSSSLISDNNPPQNSSNTKGIGESILSYQTGHFYDAIKLTSEGTTSRSKNGKYEVGTLFVNFGTKGDYELFASENDPTMGIKISKSNKEKVYSMKNTAGKWNVSYFDKIPTFTYTTVPNLNRQYSKKELLYNGKSGNTIKFSYREFSDSYARPAFTQELQYDLSESDVIGFQDVRLKVIKATNTNIEYVVNNGFQK